ncbi:hypothetical protein M9H77_22590 [Catharanthus roseus]|uniref:Uncharacterized protein n=1 Tax=Catharanthus roseus TaxID=4058 RepID=A0ACC0AQI3_CATRO|nr:hypothetical protein M9H77_22590 [Catharanthus roseus]
MEEADEKNVVNNLESYPRKLNLNAPLLSTRKPIGMKNLEMPRTNSSIRISRDFCERIPFSWEQSPGKPKEIESIRVGNRDDDDDTNGDLNFIPPPKLPPSRWFPATEDEIDNDQSDVIDVFSLGQSTDMVEPGDEIQIFGFEGLETEENFGSHSPNFMIQRFLPDAKALAASSSSSNSVLNNNSKNSIDFEDGRVFSRAISLRQSYDPTTKGCGLDIFFPWRMKPKPCGTKNPVILHQKPPIRCTRRQK